ncbi:unnamed protein product, partial [Polarella glacialis]
GNGLGGLEGGALEEPGHLEAAVECIEAAADEAYQVAGQLATRSGRVLTPSTQKPRVLVVGCGLSPLVFALADRGKVDVGCVELSATLLEHLEASSSSFALPRPPHFFAVGDITDIEKVSSPHIGRASFDLVVDENLLDGMACRFPASEGLASFRQALLGIGWLLRPSGRLLTFSFTPFHEEPYAAVLKDWVPQAKPCPSGALDTA